MHQTHKSWRTADTDGVPLVIAVVKVVVVGEGMVGCNMAVLVILVKTRGFILVMKELIG